MNNDKTPYTPYRSDASFNFNEIVRIFLVNWYWFMLSLLLCIGLAIIYLQWAPKIYTRTATVLIKENSKGAVINEASVFEEMNLLTLKSNVDNEILMFRSKRLMKDVVDRLNLDVSYTVKEKIKETDLYTRSPLRFVFPEALPSQRFSFYAMIIENDQVLLWDIPGFGLDSEYKVNLNDTLETPLGKIVVQPSLYYSDSYRQVPIHVRKKDTDRATHIYNSRLQVNLAGSGSTMINLSIQDTSIPRAEDILNTLIAVYNEEVINDKNRIAINTSLFIAGRLRIIEQELGEVDSEIEIFKRAHRLTDIRSETGVYMQATSLYNTELMELENLLTLSQYVRDYLTSAGKSDGLIPANIGLTDNSIDKQINEYNELLLRRDKLVTSNNTRNPVVMDINSSLEALRQNIIRAIDNLIAGTRIKIENVLLREEQTNRRIADVPSQQKYVLSVERQQKIKESLYLYLLNKRESSALTQAITESNAMVVDSATGNNEPVAPRPLTILMGAGIAGLFIPIVIIWLSFLLNNTVRNSNDLVDVVTIPYLGSVPLRSKTIPPEILVSPHGDDPFSEKLRLIRTRIDHVVKEGIPVQVITFVSSNHGVGKTFLASNLAVSFALTGKKILLMELDIRKDSLLAHYTGYQGEGITGYLSEKKSNWKKLIVNGELHPCLDIIYAGVSIENPSELLLRKQLDLLMQQLRSQYDYIIIDNTVTMGRADTFITNRLTDLTLYIIRSGLIEKSQLAKIEKLYQEKMLENVYTLINGTTK